MKRLAGLELTGRAWHIAEVMQEHLPRPFAAAAEILVASLDAPLTSTEHFGLAPLRYMAHVFFVQKYGLDDFEAAMHAQYELTKRFSAESSIRAFLVRYPDATYARLVQWSADTNAHVRRLVSEGTRPRLPWAPRLQAFIDDPRPVLELLELLKDDPVRYVQRSVANNLNDISKDHPEIVVQTCRHWSKAANAGRQWIVRHAESLQVEATRSGRESFGGTRRPDRLRADDDAPTVPRTPSHRYRGQRLCLPTRRVRCAAALTCALQLHQAPAAAGACADRDQTTWAAGAAGTPLDRRA